MRWLALFTLGTLGALGLAGCPTSNNTEADGGVVTGCTKASDCSEALLCVAGLCASAHSVDPGGKCWSTRDCSGSNYCSPIGRCVASGNGTPGAGCVTDGDCVNGYRCDLAGLDGYCEQGGTADVNENCSTQKDCLAGLFCGPAGTCGLFLNSFPKPAGAVCETETTFRAYFIVPRGGQPLADFFRLPWPNDARVTTSGAKKTLDLGGFYKPGPSLLGPDIVKLYLDALVADFDGFTPAAPVVFRFSQDIGDKGFNALVSSIKFIDLTTGVPLGAQFGYATGRSQFNCANYLSVLTGAGPPIAPGHTYGVYFGTNVTSAGGTVGAADPDLAAVLGDTKPSDADLGRVWESYAPLRAHLKTESVPVNTILNATVFTAATPSSHMQRLAAAVAAEGTPAITALIQCGTGATDPCDDGTDARKCGASSPDYVELHGKLTMPQYLKGTEPYETAGGGLNESGDQVTKVKPLDVCFALTLPTGATPGAGWPLVVYAHGTGGSFRDFIANGIATKLAQAKIAGMSYDAIGHGARRGSSKRPSSELVFNILNPQVARDTPLQGGADVLTALKIARSSAPSGYPGPAWKLDKDKVAFFGHSQGATAGQLALPFTDDTKAVILGGGGALLSQSLYYKTSPSNIRGGLTALLNDAPTGDHPVVLIWQNYFDRADPVNSGALMIQAPPLGRSPKNVFFAWGTKDTYTPVQTLQASAFVLGVAKTDPLLEDFSTEGGSAARPVSRNVNGVTAAAFQYAPGSYDGHFVDSRNADAVKDWSAFLTSFFATGTATVP